MGINSHYEISQNNLAPCSVICIFTQDRGIDSVSGYILFFFPQFIEEDSCLWLAGVATALLLLMLFPAYDLGTWVSLGVKS